MNDGKKSLMIVGVFVGFVIALAIVSIFGVWSEVKCVTSPTESIQYIDDECSYKTENISLTGCGIIQEYMKNQEYIDELKDYISQLEYEIDYTDFECEVDFRDEYRARLICEKRW